MRGCGLMFANGLACRPAGLAGRPFRQSKVLRVGSDTWDTAGLQPAKGGSIPTPALHTIYVGFVSAARTGPANVILTFPQTSRRNAILRS